MVDRDTLEQQALQAVCPCQYYDLADCLSETTDDELSAIINETALCTNCDG